MVEGEGMGEGDEGGGGEGDVLFSLEPRPPEHRCPELPF